MRFEWEGLVEWRRGFLKLSPQLMRDIDEKWSFVNDSVLADSQGTVHIVTGNLLSTGRTFLQHPSFGAVAGGVEYGGIQGHGNPPKFVDYAVFEEDLHPFLAPAGQRALPRYRKAMQDTYQDTARIVFKGGGVRGG